MAGERRYNILITREKGREGRACRRVREQYCRRCSVMD
jgi:hypothetical protein